MSLISDFGGGGGFTDASACRRSTDLARAPGLAPAESLGRLETNMFRNLFSLALAILVGALSLTSFVGRALAQADPTMRTWTLDPSPLNEEATLSGPHSDEGNGWLSLDVRHVEGRLPENLVFSESFSEGEIPMGFDPIFRLRVNYPSSPGLTVRVHYEGWQGSSLPQQRPVVVPNGDGIEVLIPISGVGDFDFLRRLELWFGYEWGAETALHMELDRLEVDSSWDGAYLLDDFGDAPVGVAGETPESPAGATVVLGPPSPNPFNPRATIPFQLAEAGSVNLAIYDMSGRKVTTLVNGETSAGPHTVMWDGNDASGTPVPSGLYLARLEAGGQQLTRRMLLVK